MKHRILFLLVAMFLVSGISKTMAQNADLKGIWQMCFYVSGDPTIPGELKPSNSFKILSDDGKFTNMTVIPNKGAIIIGSGTYKQTAPNAFTEHVEKNLSLQAFPTYSVSFPFPLPNTFFPPYVICASPQIRFGFTHSRANIRNIHFNSTL